MLRCTGEKSPSRYELYVKLVTDVFCKWDEYGGFNKNMFGCLVPR